MNERRWSMRSEAVGRGMALGRGGGLRVRVSFIYSTAETIVLHIHCHGLLNCCKTGRISVRLDVSCA